MCCLFPADAQRRNLTSYRLPCDLMASRRHTYDAISERHGPFGFLCYSSRCDVISISLQCHIEVEATSFLHCVPGGTSLEPLLLPFFFFFFF